MIKTSKHTIKFANTNKQTKLKEFMIEYRRVAPLILDHLWNNSFSWKNHTLDIANHKYDCPSFISTGQLKYEKPYQIKSSQNKFYVTLEGRLEDLVTMILSPQ